MPMAFLFPGQGSQAIGMGQALAQNFPEARAVFDEVDDALSQRLSRVMFEGPDADLTLTANAQPALMAVSLAVTRVLEAEAGLDIGRDARFLAGHSLGEYSALAAARSFTLGDAARLLRRRGEAMQQAVPVGVGAMAAILGLEFAPVAEAAKEAAKGDVCQAANDNGGGQVVISGTLAAVERAIEACKAKGAKRALMLPVSAPFHCALMQPAADAMAEALATVDLGEPIVPIVANVSAEPVQDPQEIRRLLVEQVTGTVRWRESMGRMADEGVTLFFELGAGKVLSGLVKRVAPNAAGFAINGPADVDVFLKNQER